MEKDLQGQKLQRFENFNDVDHQRTVFEFLFCRVQVKFLDASADWIICFLCLDGGIVHRMSGTGAHSIA